MKIIEKLSTYAALLGVIGAIGGGFYTWGQFNSRLDAIEATPPVNLKPLKEKDKELEAKIDDALLYANEYKVDLIDRIKKVDDKINYQVGYNNILGIGEYVEEKKPELESEEKTLKESSDKEQLSDQVDTSGSDNKDNEPDDEKTTELKEAE